MATIADRISLIVRSNVNELLNKFEDPVKVIDQAIIDEKNKYAKLLNESAQIFGQEKIARDNWDRQLKKAEEEHTYAIKALEAGNEADAKTLLVKEQEIKKKAETYKITYDAIKQSADVIRKNLQTAKDNIQNMQDKAAEIKAKSTAAKVVGHAAEVAGNAKNISVDNDFSRLQEKAEAAYATAMGKAEFVAIDATPNSLEEKYKNNTGDDADALLASLKTEIKKQ